MQQAVKYQFWQDRSGATIIEFALVAPIFFLLIFAIIEYGLYMFHRVAIESITMQAGREATLGRTAGNGACSGTNDRVSYIQCVVRQKSSRLIRGGDTIININRVADGGTFVPDICYDNPDRPSSAPATCRQWEPVNTIPEYQGASAANNPGTAGDVIEVQVVYPWRVLIPFMSRFFGSADNSGRTSGVVMIRSATVVKNEPF